MILLILLIVLIVLILIIIYLRIIYCISRQLQYNKINVIYTPINQLNDWEKDYIAIDLLKNFNINYININYLKNNTINSYDNILIFSSNDISYEEIDKIVDRIKPIIIIHLSDEWGYNEKYLELSKKTNLYLRQYNFSYYNINSYINCYQIPLGYMTNMLNGTSSINIKDIKNINKRKYTWSFIGNMKKDRMELINKFKLNFPNYYFDKTDPSNIFNIYNDSIFVPNG